jgi:hypothetical protein
LQNQNNYELPSPKCIGYSYANQNSAQAKNFLVENNAHINLDLRNTTLGYGFRFQHRNTRTVPIDSFAHESGRNMVRAEYGYPKGFPNKSAATALNTVLASEHTQSTYY